MEIVDFSVINRHNGNENEKCPRCLTIFVNFMEAGKNTLACLNCGTVFVKKDVREFVRLHQKRIMELEEQIEEHANNPLVCACGFEAKSNAGLVAHKRKCEKGG